MPISRDYPEDFVDKALELAAAIGIRPAARQLEVSEGTIRGWTKHPEALERYAELRKQNAPKWRERAAATLEELVDGYTKLEVDAMEKAAAAIDELEPRDVANFLRSVAVAKGVNADHVAKLRGQPNVVVERRIDAAQLEQAMAALLGAGTVDADEVTDVTEVEALPAPEPEPHDQD